MGRGEQWYLSVVRLAVIVELDVIVWLSITIVRRIASRFVAEGNAEGYQGSKQILQVSSTGEIAFLPFAFVRPMFQSRGNS